MGGKKKYIEMFGSFIEPFNWKPKTLTIMVTPFLTLTLHRCLYVMSMLLHH